MPREARKKLKVKAPPLCPALPDRRGGPAALALVCKPAGLRTLLGGPPRRGARAGFVFDSWEGPAVARWQKKNPRRGCSCVANPGGIVRVSGAPVRRTDTPAACPQRRFFSCPRVEWPWQISSAAHPNSRLCERRHVLGGHHPRFHCGLAPGGVALTAPSL